MSFTILTDDGQITQEDAQQILCTDNPHKMVRANLFIETGYVWGEGHSTQSKANFQALVERTKQTITEFKQTKDLSFEVTGKYSASDRVFGMSDMYFHPQNLTITMKAIYLIELVERLEKIEGFQISHLSINRTYDSIAIEDFGTYLDEQRDDKIKNILKRTQAAKRNQVASLQAIFTNIFNFHGTSRRDLLPSIRAEISRDEEIITNHILELPFVDHQRAENDTLIKLKSKTTFNKSTQREQRVVALQQHPELLPVYL
ncbi:hypothetical protein A6E01_19505 (plasmid) [Vibrio breoganii]|uniref:Uncharacterized protein n=3 Tax=Vibrio TaxID=662 RepID=A0AAN0XZG8_9VIBR|nr:hypothetical protein [Vibrio breoganii]ANO35401.1 hypothetical protein A6E01_19505 [Vibrio breoganii]PML12674.1 hypothetical protein BCT84_01985 [Vibrio breoganii]